MKTQTGLSLWIGSANRQTKKLRLGLVSHPAAVLPDLTDAASALLQAGYHLTALFGPEHGFGGAAPDGAPLANTRHSRTGLPIFSLYGETFEPTAEMLSQVDALLFDMQDVGVRFYTYLSTLFYVLRACGRSGKTIYVLDRPNPIGGLKLEGGPVEKGAESFVGIANFPIRHALTLGEAARLLNAEYALGADLQVIAMRGWRRSLWFDQTGLPWVPPSPAMPHLSAATLYPGLCLLEGTPLSLGRGTSLPFEICGAPGLDGETLAAAMNTLHLPGARFRPVSFAPWASKYAGLTCGGVQIHITEREMLSPVSLALHLIAQSRRLLPAWEWNAHFDRLTGGSQVRLALEAGTPVEEILASWDAFLEQFRQISETYRLY